jgi:hypothetical protein
MASKKLLSGSRIVEVLFDEDDLIPESDYNDSDDNERTRSPEIALISDVADKATTETLPGNCPHLSPFTANAGLNSDIQNTDIMTL